jgi:tRNA pseudouridine55 synthase
MNGFVLIHKPEGITSYDVIRQIKPFVGKKEKIGHSGTLDPFATGLMIIAIGRDYTRQLNQLLLLDKTYRAQITFGVQTDSYDRTGHITHTHSSPIALNRDIVMPMIQSFIGEIHQMPPQFSAKKINGKPAYVYARKSTAVELKQSLVTIHSIVLNDITDHVIDISVHCSKGTYIRSLAHDMGQFLSFGAHLSQLSRESIGSIHVTQSLDLCHLSESTLSRYLLKQLNP